MDVRRSTTARMVQPGENALPAVAASGSSMALCLMVVALLAAGAAGAALDGSAATIAACLALLLFGLPHGSLDLEIIKREHGASKRSMIALLLLYLGLAAAMWAIWIENPVAALVVFLGVAIVHFGEDWPELHSAFLSQGLALSLLTAPVWFHGDALRAIFAALTGTNESGSIAEVMLLLAPASTAIAAVALWTLWRAGQRERAGTALLALVAMVLLPPVIGFACFFCLYHSPRHYGESLRRVAANPRATAIVMLVTLAALGLAVALFREAAGADVPARVIAASFTTLSLLTVPHMLVPLIVDRCAARVGRSRHRMLKGDHHAHQGSSRVYPQG